MGTLRDRMWIWGHVAGSHNTGWHLPADSRMTPVEAAYYLDVRTLIMVCYGGLPQPPFDQHALAHSTLDRVVWSIVGDSGSKRNDEQSDLDEVLRVAAKHPNITGAMMDDFFHAEKDTGSADVGRYTSDELREFQRRLHEEVRRLDLWVVLYEHELHLDVARHLEFCDVVTFWTWNAPDLAELEANFARFEEKAGSARKVLGCYMWDYGLKRPMPVECMEKQCELARQWIRSGRIEGMIFLSNCVCDLGLEAVEWTRRWVARVGDEEV